jgi:hypothetical protein
MAKPKSPTKKESADERGRAAVLRVADEPDTSTAAGPWGAGVGEQIEHAINGSLRTVRGVLPSKRLPVALAGAALLVTGLLDPPVVLGLGLAYEALRHWEPGSAAA